MFDIFEFTHPAEAKWIVNNAPHNTFAASLMNYAAKKGDLTAGQIAAIRRSMTTKSVKVDVSGIFEAFGVAVKNGLKRPNIRVEGLYFTLAPSTGINAGYIYVKSSSDYDNSTYYGKISPEGVFHAMRECDDAVKARIVEVSSNILAAAIAYGQKYGNCSFCGKQLTNRVSRYFSRGPICSQKWGLAHEYNEEFIPIDFK